MFHLSLTNYCSNFWQFAAITTRQSAAFVLLLIGCIHCSEIQSMQILPVGTFCDTADIAQVELDKALNAFKQAGGVAEWVNRKDSHLIIHRYNTKELKIPLTNLAILPQVRTLTLHGFDFEDDDLKVISNWKHLEGLHLINNHGVTDTGIKSLERMTKLKELILWGTKITDIGMKTIGSLTSLESLNIENSPVSDLGLEVLKSAKKLTKVTLLGTKVTQAGVNKLKQKMPNCQIEID